jgi:DDE superfamily endonuclease
LIAEIAAAHPQQRIEVWFQDEARFGQQGTLTRLWAPVGSRPRAVRQTQYDYLYVLAAVCPRTGNSAGLLAPNLNTHTVNVFFDQLAREIAPDVHVVLIWDQAGYHTSGDLKVPANVTFVAFASAITGAQSGGEPLALFAKPPLVQPQLQ